MDISKLKLNWASITNDKPAILVSCSEAFKFENGKYTDEVDHYKVYVCLLGMEWEKVAVKVTEKPVITEEMFGKARVHFEGFTAKFYRNSNTGHYDVSCNAKSLVVEK
ncbi:MAG: hypothetical protein IK138_03185 [Lachnospiraceae bacterium]|nr:hypothetical protein [Lachnospiraceae bacterium]